MKIFAFADEASPNIDEQIIALQENGLDGLEIRNVDGINVADITEEKAFEVKAKLDKAGLCVFSVGSPIGKISIKNKDQHLEKFKGVLKIAKILGAENIRIFSLYIDGSREPDEYTDEVITFLKELTALAKDEGIVLCHENEKGIFGDTAERCLKIHRKIPEIKAIFDPANYIQCSENPVKAWEMLKPYVKYLHIKDALTDGNIVSAGNGVGNIPFIVREFVKSGGNTVTIEPHLAVFSGLSELEQQANKRTVGKIYRYSSNREAFDTAVLAFKKICEDEKI